MMRFVLATVVAAFLFAFPATSSAISVRGFHAYDAGGHITYKWTVCTSYPVRAQWIISYGRVGSGKEANRTYNVQRYRRGCTHWVLPDRDDYASGEWAAFIEVGPNRGDGAVSKIYRYYVG
jgi:hypothetical protein